MPIGHVYLLLQLIYFFLKKFLKILLRSLLGLFVLLLILWALLQTSFFQNFITRQVTTRLSKNLHTTVSIKHVDFDLFNKMNLEGTLILDKNKDTLLYAGVVRVNITDWFFFKKNIVLKYISLQDAVINMNRDTPEWNYQFLVDYFSSPSKKSDTSKNVLHLDLKTINLKNVSIRQTDEWRGENRIISIGSFHLDASVFDLSNNLIKVADIKMEAPSFSQFDYTGKRPRDTTIKKNDVHTSQNGLQWNSEGWQIYVDNIQIKNGFVANEREGGDTPVPGMFDENHLILSKINGSFKNFSFLKDTIRATIDLTARDRGGFEIKKLSADYTLTPELMEFKNLDLITPKSRLRDYFSMRYHSFNEDMNNFVHAVQLDGNFKNSVLNSDDLAYFAPAARTWKINFSLEGNAKGKIDNLTAKKMIIKAGEKNYLDGDISLRGLPDIEMTFIDLRSRNMRTSYNELSRLIPALRTITNPDLAAFGNLQFTGSYTGYVRDFVAFGTLNTDIGTLNTDLHLKVPAIGPAQYEGHVTTQNFQLGRFITNNQVGNISFDGKINGSGFSEKEVSIKVDGSISKVGFNNYNYSNIIAHGVFRNKLFSGSASINDPNVKIDTLVGSINFSKTKPQLALNAKVNQLNLKSLHFTNDSISVTGKFDLNFTGNNIDNFLGSAKLYDAELYDGGQHLSFDSLIVNSSVVNNKKLLTINTNELDASINGQFKIMELPVAFQLLLSKYYPAYIARPKNRIANEDFTFLVKTRYVANYLNLFNKELQGLDNSIFIGNININANTLNVQADIPQFKYSQFTFNNIHVTARGNADTLVLNTEIDDVVINDSLHSPDTKIKVVAANDVSDVTIKTSANRTLTAADLSARILTFERGFKLTFNHSTFTINQKQWDIEKDGEIELRNKMLMASKIKFSQNGQEIFISTRPSEINNSNDLVIAAQNLIIEDFTPLFMKTPKMSGLFYGNISVNDPFGKLSVDFDTRLTAFKLENDSIGVITAGGEYNGFSKNLKVNAFSDNQLYNFSAGLLLQPSDSTKPLSGSIVFKNSSIHILENYLGDIFSNIKGNASGNLSVAGKMKSPVITGSVTLDSAALTVDYTQCRYHLADHSVITFNPDEIDFGSIKLIDTLFNTATLSGKIYHNFFDNFFFNELHLSTDQNGNGTSKFLLLNTTEKDNSQFYGRVIGKASLSLNGFVSDLRMNISGEITDSSHIYLPTGETAETGSIDYIEFIQFGREMKPDLKSRESTNIKVDMEILANPLAKIDVILDETTGDVIKAQGSGRLNISAGTKDPLTIRGRYDIEEGEYTFNFQTFLKTPFTLEKGYIEWQGDPYLANLNIDAVYKAKGVVLNNIPTTTGIANSRGDIDILFKLRGTLKNPSPAFEFQFPFDNPLKSDPIANEYLRTKYQSNNQLLDQVASLLLFNTFINNDQGLITGNNTGNFVTKTVGQLLSATLTSSLNSWLQKLLNTSSVNLYTNINTSDFNFQKGGTQKEIQNVGDFGLKTAFLNNKLLVTVGGNVDYRLGQAVTNTNSNFLFTPDVSFEYLITPDGRLRVVGFNHSDTDPGDIAGVTRRNRTGIQLSYRKDFDTFREFFTKEKRIKIRK